MKTPDYLSYEKYKKKKDNNPNKRLLIFVTTFFITLLLFSVVAKNLSPDVDVTIGDESQTDVKETGLGVKRFIDERLKMIQMEDQSADMSIKDSRLEDKSDRDVGFYDEVETAEEKVNLPYKTNKYNDQMNEEPIYLSPPRPSGMDLSRPAQSTKMSKVYVGRYTTLEQAKVAQEILIDSGLDVTPFIKDLGGIYTLQIGSYLNNVKAEALASEFKRNGFPARVVQE